MVLILGGMGAGKKTYAKTLGFSDAQMNADVHSDAPVLLDLDKTVRNDPDGAAALLPLLRKKTLVLCCEVGSGVVPLDAKDRAYREAVGRLCCALAEEADAVVRVVAGIPMLLKGEWPCRYD
jgi:adenosyl cobinamide kinase/adenosyl cobinamide phosphate guanylyltransferase